MTVFLLESISKIENGINENKWDVNEVGYKKY